MSQRTTEGSRGAIEDHGGVLNGPGGVGSGRVGKIDQKIDGKMPKTQGFSHQIEELQIQIFTEKLD